MIWAFLEHEFESLNLIIGNTTWGHCITYRVQANVWLNYFHFNQSFYLFIISCLIFIIFHTSISVQLLVIWFLIYHRQETVLLQAPSRHYQNGKITTRPLRRCSRGCSKPRPNWSNKLQFLIKSTLWRSSSGSMRYLYCLGEVESTNAAIFILCYFFTIPFS